MTQPDSTPNDAEPVVTTFVRYLGERMKYGITKYGIALQPHNGRDADVDRFEEAVDLCLYFAQKLIERDGHLPEVVMPSWADITERAQIKILKEFPEAAPAGWYYDEVTARVCYDPARTEVDRHERQRQREDPIQLPDRAFE